MAAAAMVVLAVFFVFAMAVLVAVALVDAGRRPPPHACVVSSLLWLLFWVLLWALSLWTFFS